MSCTAAVTLAGTLGYDLLVAGTTISSGTVTLAGGTATVADSTLPAICKNGTYSLSGSTPVSGTLSAMTATLDFGGGGFTGVLTASQSGNAIVGTATITSSQLPGAAPIVGSFTLPIVP
jgi:hypothetical protein